MPIMKSKATGEEFDVPDSERNDALATGKFDEFYLAKAKADGKEFMIPAQELQDALKTGKFELSEFYDQKKAIADKKLGVGESAAIGLGQGLSGDNLDEIAAASRAPLGAAKEIANKFGAGFDDADVSKYKSQRGELRAADRLAEKSNPGAYTGSKVVGGVAQSFAPGLNVVKGASLANMTGKAAIQGGLAGLGASDEESLSGIAKDVGTGVAIGGGTTLAIGGATKAIADFNKRNPNATTAMKDKFNKMVAKIYSKTSGADEEAILRQIQNPAAQRAAEEEGFSYAVGSKAKEGIEGLGRDLSNNVAEARDTLVEKFGDKAMTGLDDIEQGANKFLSRNAPSKAGFSGLKEKDREALIEITGNLKDATADDLVKFRNFVDSKVAHLYDRPDAATPFERQLMKMRGQADDLLDKFSPELNKANTDFSNYMGNKKVLGLNNDATVETITDNLYSGANKTAKKAAAEAIVPANLIEDMKTIAANKSFEAAKRPGGSNYLKRAALPLATGFTSELFTNPNIVKFGARGLGELEQKIGSVLSKNPEAFGKFAGVLSDAARRGGNALALTHYVLSQKNPEYQGLIQNMEE